MKLIPDFASMTEEKRFASLKFGVAYLFVLYGCSLSLANANGPRWIETIGQAVVFLLFSYVAIATTRGILFLERRSKKQTPPATAAEP